MTLIQEDQINMTPDENNKPKRSKPLSRKQILNATAKCLIEFGYDATTIRKIASTLNCAVGSIYRYFKDKRHLLYAVSQSSLEPVALILEQAQDQNSNTLETTTRLYYQRAAAAPEIYRLMFWLSCAVQRDTQDHQPIIVTRIIQGWASLLNSKKLAFKCWAQLHASILAQEDEHKTINAIADILKESVEVKITPQAQNTSLLSDRINIDDIQNTPA